MAPMITKRQALIDQLHTLALCVGLRAAARQLGINEDTASGWSRRGNWKLAEVFKLTDAPLRQNMRREANASTAHEALAEAFAKQSEDTRLFLSAASLKAAHDASKATGAVLREKNASTGMLNVARTADVVHGWTAARAIPLVNVQAVILPTAQEDAKRKAIDVRLDEISALLNAPSPTKAGEGVSVEPRGSEAKPVA